VTPSPPPLSSLPAPAWRSALADMSPANFGMVMATGIVSIAAHMLGQRTLALGLFALNLFLYLLMWGLYLARLLLFRQRFLADLLSHLRGPAFFTAVAATNVLGSQCLLLMRWTDAGLALWCVGLTLWLLLTYTIFTALTIKEDKPTLDRGISGGWLLAVVATQSVAVLSALLATHIGQPYRLELNFFALSMWLWGGMLYIWMMSLIFYRYTFFPFSPGDLSPPYWINMGAMAISTLAGSLLIVNTPDAPFLASLLPFLKGFTVFYWATGTWWIPMLLVLAVWRYGVKRFGLHYDPLYWGAVFPLGMYAACTQEMRLAMGFDFLSAVPVVFFGIALLTWTVAGFGAARQAWRIVFARP
jgi:tellurite resistance protein TehA-like permease